MLVESVADRKSVSAEDTIRLSIESRSSRVICGVRRRLRKTSLSAALKRVKTFSTVCSIWSVGRGQHVRSVFYGCCMLAWYIAGVFALLL